MSKLKKICDVSPWNSLDIKKNLNFKTKHIKLKYFSSFAAVKIGKKDAPSFVSKWALGL